MGTVHAFRNKDDALGVLLRAAVKAAPHPEPPHDEFFDILSGPLEEPARVTATPRQGTDNEVILLRLANARLRALAIELSNLAGDLPVPR
jgi:hypothetical protein